MATQETEATAVTAAGSIYPRYDQDEGKLLLIIF